MDLLIKNLNKTYKNGVRALHDINLTVPPGLFGLLGPNGAGKSTLMRTIATLQEADSGSITLGELDIIRQKTETRMSLGYLPQEFGVYPHVSAETLLDHLALLKGFVKKPERKEVVDRLLKLTNLHEVRRKNLGGYSGGMKQRFGIAQALIGDPRLLIVDEPTAGLDPEERVRFYNILSEVGRDSVVILSTHIVADITVLCENMAIINKGEIIYVGNPLLAVERLQGKVWLKKISKEDLTGLAGQYQMLSTKMLGGKQIIHVFDSKKPGQDFEDVVPDLEDAYFAAIKGYIQ